MPSGSADGEVSSESDDLDETESSEMESSEATDAGTPDGSRPKDPILLLADSFEPLFRRIDGLYARFEEFTGRVKFGLGVVSFLSSAYFGTVIRTFLDAFVIAQLAPAVEILAGFAPGIRLVLLLLLFLVVQSSVTNQRLKSIGNIVEDEEMDSDDAVTDGGVRVKSVETSEAGALGGAAIGAAFGGLFGYGTIFGGMIFGAIVGDLIEERSARKRKRRRLKTKIVAYLLRERVFAPEFVEAETVRNWFPADDSPFVTEAVEDLLGDGESPVVRISDEKFGLTNPSEAVTYLDRNGGRIPSEFAGPNRPQ